MKNILKTIGIVLVAIFAFIGFGETMIELFGTDHQKEQLINSERELSAYEYYYDATETLLDSVGMDIDNPCFETDYGSNYLDAKAQLDSVYDANHKYGLRLTQKVVEDTRVKH